MVWSVVFQPELPKVNKDASLTPKFFSTSWPKMSWRDNKMHSRIPRSQRCCNTLWKHRRTVGNPPWRMGSRSQATKRSKGKYRPISSSGSSRTKVVIMVFYTTSSLKISNSANKSSRAIYNSSAGINQLVESSRVARLATNSRADKTSGQAAVTEKSGTVAVSRVQIPPMAKQGKIAERLLGLPLFHPLTFI